MTVRLLDTLSGELVPLPPTSPEAPYEVKLYVCGITPYSASHVGHAVPAVVFDTLRRYLEYRGYGVRHITNFTDIDDKLINRANELGTTVKALADQYSDLYLGSLAKLNILRAAYYPRATEELPRIIELTQGLVDNGYAYVSSGDVYYRVRKKADYGKLSHRNIDDLLSGARVDPTELKEDPLDFALWKSAKPGEPAWESPWGPGRPGWHIECSAMSWGHLGEQIDIHGGGADLIFPHHENEIAQTEGFTGKVPFARTWMHNALLQMGADKMSKSLGNVIGLDELADRWGADTVRLFVLSSHYRSPVSYSEEALDAARKGSQRLREAALGLGPPVIEGAGETGTITDPTEFEARFQDAMDEDLNTSKAIAMLFELAREVNRLRAAGVPVVAQQELLQKFCGVLGFTLEAPAVANQEAAPFIDLLVSLRKDLREAKQWALSDRIRDELAGLGVELKDSPSGTTWAASS